MSETWEQYFDYYLDGKPAPTASPEGRRRRGADRRSTSGWITRNCSAEPKNGVLQIKPLMGGSRVRRPFIATDGLNLPSSLTAVVRLRAENSDTAGFAWREEGQNHFPPKQVVTFECPASTQWQEYSVKLPAHGKVMHVRLLLPATGADIQRIEFRDIHQKPLKTWQFGQFIP
jgi:hypothetical protein